MYRALFAVLYFIFLSSSSLSHPLTSDQVHASTTNEHQFVQPTNGLVTKRISRTASEVLQGLSPQLHVLGKKPDDDFVLSPAVMQSVADAAVADTLEQKTESAQGEHFDSSSVHSAIMGNTHTSRIAIAMGMSRSSSSSDSGGSSGVSGGSGRVVMRRCSSAWMTAAGKYYYPGRGWKISMRPTKRARSVARFRSAWVWAMWRDLHRCVTFPRLTYAQYLSVLKQYICHVAYGAAPFLGGWTWDFEAWRPNINGYLDPRRKCNW